MENLSTNDIEREMKETRTSMADKIAALENQVVGTIQSANDAVADTVENVKSVVTETVDSVKDAVTSVKGTVQGMTESVKDTFDVGSKVRENPWIAVSSSIAAGFVSGILLGKSGSRSSETKRSRESTSREPIPSAPMFQTARSTAPSQPKRASWLDDIFHRLEQQAKKLGEAAVSQLGDALIAHVGQIVPGIVEKMKSMGSGKRHEPQRNGGSSQGGSNGGHKGFARHVG